MEEKIGMEKLIELLNEYETPRSGVVYKSYDDYDGFFYGVDIDGETEIAWSDSLICSKKFGFIKWLVENDKIDKKKIDTRLVRNVESHYDEDGYWVENSYEDYSDINTLLMLLSISDTPIEDLILYLK